MRNLQQQWNIHVTTYEHPVGQRPMLFTDYSQKYGELMQLRVNII